MTETIRVQVGHFEAVKNPTKIEIQALGSCVGIVLYDKEARVGGMAHPMLPNIASASAASRNNLGKFVDTAIDELIKEMLKQGAKKENIIAKLSGGANMFPEITTAGSLQIGMRNIESAGDKLKILGISVIAEDTGGTFGRTITLDTINGKLKIRTAMQGEKEI